MHFTYAAPDTTADLQQGDVLKRTPALDQIVTTYHPYYSAKSDYTHFLVLTQSCDLVRRSGRPCSAPYISVAAVRPLYVALEREATRFQDAILRRAKAVGLSNRNQLDMFVVRLLNNNHKEYFYLHEDNAFELRSSCAFLRLAISIRSEEHYGTCLEARIASLNAEFQSKLGWLIGDIYSRVGTVDWDSASLRKEVKSILGQNYVWLDDEKLKETNIPEDELNTMKPEAIISRVNGVKLVKKKDRVIEAVLAELRAGSYIEEGDLAAIKQRLQYAPTVSALLKN